ncbi:MAG: lysine 6-monooxygenase [Proteobacteria bacterium]|nr:MAG: lysine 6-monooxygenase [Pseudomonadota bacterium]
MQSAIDLLGIGIGPFNLSLAALSSSVNKLKSRFFEQKASFEWHSELFFSDATMQTTYLKDLVTPVDPTNPNSFLNYLVQKGSFYAFLNTNRKTISRQEFEAYCRWVSERLTNTQFASPVREISHDGKLFQIRLDEGGFSSQNICIGTGMKPYLPEMARDLIGPECFHAKSKYLQAAKLEGKRVLIIGGGQTGAEIFLNSLRGMFGEPKSIRWVSRRLNLEALDESAFANDYFTPDYVNSFYDLPQRDKDRVVAQQKLTSDGITPGYLEGIYRELYHRQHVQVDGAETEILSGREMQTIRRVGEEYQVEVANYVRGSREDFFADIVIFATGFKNVLPDCLEPLFGKLDLDSLGRPKLSPSFAMNWDGPEASRIYAVNFGRHTHGIAEPQTSLMAWRAATILNDVLGQNHFANKDSGPAFLKH